MCIVNNSSIPDELREKYHNDGADQVGIDRERILGSGIRLIEGNYASLKNNLVRHDPKKLAEAVIEAVAENVLAYDRNRSADYYYVKERLARLADMG
jgi:hypothetical protein